MILSGFALKTLENQLSRLLKNEQNDTVLQSEFDICTEQELKKTTQIRNIISSYVVNKIISSLNLNKEIVAESDLLESSFKEIKSNPPAKSDNDFFTRQN